MAEKWEPFEHQFIQEVAGIMPAALISEKLERPIAAIRAKARKLGIKLAFYRHSEPWTDEELSILNNYPNTEVARLTGRTMAAISTKRSVCKQG